MSELRDRRIGKVQGSTVRGTVLTLRARKSTAIFFSAPLNEFRVRNSVHRPCYLTSRDRGDRVDHSGLRRFCSRSVQTFRCFGSVMAECSRSVVAESFNSKENLAAQTSRHSTPSLIAHLKTSTLSLPLKSGAVRNLSRSFAY